VYDVPTPLLQSLAWVVSSWDNASANPDGTDLGIGRVNTDLVGWINTELIDGDVEVDPRSPEGNVELTAALLGHLLEVTDGDWAASIATYYLDETEPPSGPWSLELGWFVTSVLTRVPDFEATPPPAATTTTTTAPPEDRTREGVHTHVTAALGEDPTSRLRCPLPRMKVRRKGDKGRTRA
jgi:hypothetical protein